MDAPSTHSHTTSGSMREPETLIIGGTHGHVEETITGDLLVLWRAPFCHWKPIRNCTGRYSCRETRNTSQHPPQQNKDTNDTPLQRILPSTLSPLELLQHALGASKAASAGSVDTMIPHSSKSRDIIIPWKVQEFDPAPGRKDRIWVLPLDAQMTTGIITYVKQQPPPPPPPPPHEPGGTKTIIDSKDAPPSTSLQPQKPPPPLPPTIIRPSSSIIRYVHTLNAPSGFRRKLQAVGIQLTGSTTPV